jgi:hypothetical protein
MSSATAAPPHEAALAERFRRRMLHPVLFRAFLLARLPLAWFAGLRVRRLDTEGCAVTVPRGWRTQNPFRSTYFAAQSMAAELSTGALAMAAVQGAGVPVSMLVTESTAVFGKKAVADVTFVCEAGAAIRAAVEEAVRDGEGVQVEATSVGQMADGVEVARFTFVWSFKSRVLQG